MDSLAAFLLVMCVFVNDPFMSRRVQPLTVPDCARLLIRKPNQSETVFVIEVSPKLTDVFVVSCPVANVSGARRSVPNLWLFI